MERAHKVCEYYYLQHDYVVVLVGILPSCTAVVTEMTLLLKICHQSVVLQTTDLLADNRGLWCCGAVVL